MKRVLYVIIAISIALTVMPEKAGAQKKLKIGGTEIVLQSPLKFEKDIPVDTSEVVVTVEVVDKAGKVEKTTTRKKYPNYRRYYTDFYYGMGLATNASFGGEKYYPSVQYGNSMDIMTGLKFFYRPARWYAVGTQIQYSFYSYRIDGAAQAGFIGEDVPGIIQAEYFRSDNIGTAWLNRFIIHRRFFIELGVYGDYSVSKRFMLKTNEGKVKYRDAKRFTPLQAGLQASINVGCFSLYTKYRLTDMFNHEYISCEPPRLNVGAMLTF